MQLYQHSPSHDASDHSHTKPYSGQGEQDKSELDCVFVVTHHELSIGAISIATVLESGKDMRLLQTECI